jgi:hypothetical protein
VSAAEALRIAHAAGVTVIVDGEELVLEANTEPPRAVLDALSRNKLSILELLHPARAGWTAEQWRAYFDKRCRIATSELLSAEAAKLRAIGCCVIEWLNQHPAPSLPGRCAWCGRPESASAVVLPFGTEPGTHAWLHAECWPAWHQARRVEAIVALRTGHSGMRWTFEGSGSRHSGTDRFRLSIRSRANG